MITRRQRRAASRSRSAKPVISWSASAAMTYGGALGNGQLNATANVAGTFVDTPAAGAVLAVGAGQPLSVSFTPTDTADYTTATASTTINVNAASTTPASLVVKKSLTRSGGNIVVQLTIANSGGTAAANVVLTNVTIGGVAGTPLSKAVGTIAAAASAQVTITVPGSAGASGAASSLVVSGTYTGGHSAPPAELHYRSQTVKNSEEQTMKTRFFTALAFAALCVAITPARAGVMITLDNPNQFGAPGETLQFFGTITNLDTANTVYLNSDSLNFIAPSPDFLIGDQFFVNVPLSLGAEASSGDIELFDVTVSDPFTDAFTSYPGTYQLLGGIDGSAQDVLGGVSFSVTPVAGTPEPVSSGLLASGLLGISVFRRRRTRCRADA